LGESSKKSHIADVILTIGKGVDCPNHLHVCYVAKNRRGENTKAFTIRLNNGRFKEIPKPLFDKLKVEPDRKDYTEQEIDIMTQEELKAQARMKQALAGVTGGGNVSAPGGGSMPNPLQSPFGSAPTTKKNQQQPLLNPFTTRP
jgi:hypothetical protein